MSRPRHAWLLLALWPCLGCRQDMHDQPRLEVYEHSSFFADGRAMRPQVPGTVARGEAPPDPHLLEGRVDGELARDFPFAITEEVLRRGRERYDIFCSVCHDRAGYGEGMVVQRGMKQPASFHIQRLRQSPPGYFFDVITNGFGAMYDYSDRIEPRDRWAIVAYVKALQFSQHVELASLPAADRAWVEGR